MSVLAHSVQRLRYAVLFTVAHDMTLGYSGTPLVKKLGIGPGGIVGVVNGPEELSDLLGALPDGVTLVEGIDDAADVVMLFVTARADLERYLPEAAEAIFPDGMVWVAWPKRASKVPTDMTEEVVRAVALPLGLVDTKVAAISDVWSGLRLVWRKERRRSPIPSRAQTA